MTNEQAKKMLKAKLECLNMAIKALEQQPCEDTIRRQAAIEAINHICPVDTEYDCTLLDRVDVRCVLSDLPSARPEQRYTEEELRVFQHGISLSLLSKRSSQHWQYDEDTATEIKFLERLYEKVGADMRGEQDG